MYVAQKRLLTAKSSGGLSPVTDGLVLWIDGRDYFSFGVTGVTNSTEFLNRADGLGIESEFKYAEVFNTNDGYLSVTDMYGGYSCLLSPTNRLRNVDINTTEVCGYLIPSGDSNKTENFQFGKIASFNYETMVSVSSSNPLLQSSVKCYTQHDGTNQWGRLTSYLNGEITSDRNGQLRTAYKCLTAMSGTGGWVRHDTLFLGSLRMYNRQLTAEEVMQNYEYERSLGRA